ncbi:hypothetical protein KB553_09135 [Chryseobacterium rhizoplanae]|uniref:imm11 family protein n=1 Tax=Chryseobacterium rhizoplanae TaxID=1609531 RepID=UPI001CE37E1E|nr:DUF1629 domain-containing protein [Chryseobacterium rhizoplanae]UCA61685.1 hypothetical protein KB553_09135 [Chryseobacterium rhizoplanae]
MDKYYLLCSKGEKGPSASAFAPEGTKLAQDLISDLEGRNQLPFKLNLIKLDVDKDSLIKSSDLSGIKELWKDYQINRFAWPLMSEKMKSIFENNLTGNEGIDWIEAIIVAPNEQRTYYIPRFNKKLDVLNMEKTMFVPGTDYTIKPVFSFSKISNYNAFTESSSKNNHWKITSAIYVSEVLKKAIQKEKLTGVSFEITAIE